MESKERTKLWIKAHAKLCPICGKSMYYRSKTCKSCVDTKIRSEEIKKLTLGSYRDKIKARDVHPSWFNSEIRGFARSWNKDLQTKPCSNCGYNKHTEICHIIPLSELPDSTTIGEANDPSNLIVLCPNCHWEFDNKLLCI